MVCDVVKGHSMGLPTLKCFALLHPWHAFQLVGTIQPEYVFKVSAEIVAPARAGRHVA